MKIKVAKLKDKIEFIGILRSFIKELERLDF